MALRVLLQRPAPDHFGGGVLHVEKTRQSLVALGLEVDQSYDLGPDLSPYDVVHLFNTPKVAELFVQCANAQRQSKPLVFSSIYWDQPRLLACMAADATLRSSAAPSLRSTTETILPAANLDRTLMSQLYGAVLGEADVVLTASEMEAGWLTRDFGLTMDRQRVAPLAADPMFARADAGEFRARCGVTDFVLCAAVLGQSKNQLRLIEALRGFDAPLVLAYTHAEAEYERRCRDAAGDNVMFIGQLDQAELASAYAAAKVHALVSCYEPTGLATLEAGLAGCNLVCTAHSPIAEYAGNRAWYADPLDTASIRRAVELAHRVPRSYILRNELLANFTWERTARLTLATYEGLLAAMPAITYHKGEARYRWLVAFRDRVEESRAAGNAVACAASAARAQTAPVSASTQIDALTRALHEREAQLEAVTHTWGYRLYHRAATSAPARLLRRLRTPGPPPVFAAPRGPALDHLASRAAELKRALVIAEATAWHVRRALADLRRALPGAHVLLAGTGERLAAARGGFDDGPVLSLTRRGYSELTGLYDVIIVVGEVGDEAVALAQRTGARIVVQYNTTGYFAGSAVIAEAARWATNLRRLRPRRAMTTWLVWLLGRAYVGYSRLLESVLPTRPIEVTCPACEERVAARLLWTAPDGSQYVRCPRCGLTQVATLPTEEEATAVYEDRGALEAYLATRTDPVTRYRHERILSHIERWVKAGRVLDVGCADGRFLEVARDASWQIEGVETSRVFIAEAERLVGPVVHPAVLQEARLSGARFDAVNMSHLIEHVRNPGDLLREAWRILRPGGVLAISTPNVGSLAARAQRGDWHLICPRQHIALYASRTLTSLVRSCGFTILESRTVAMGRVLGTLWTSRLFRLVPAAIRRLIERLEPQLNEYLAEVGMGEELLVIARKPA